jgi:hypothetical protein
MKSKIYFLLALLMAGFIYFTCTHDDSVVTSGPLVRGNNIHIAGLTAKDSTQWKFDKAHSSVLWETSYVGAAGALTGRFNQFGLNYIDSTKSINYVTTAQPLPDTMWAFYENQPEKTYFNGYVQINTSNTGEPGRDTGCNISTLGTIKIIAGTQNLTTLNLAKITCKPGSVRFDPESLDYLANIDLTWQGKLTAPLTKTLPARLHYVPRARVQFGTAAAYDVFGLQLVFQLNCRDWAIASTSVNDIIKITCNANFNNK